MKAALISLLTLLSQVFLVATISNVQFSTYLFYTPNPPILGKLPNPD
jgi:hypothetical protein